MSSRLAVYLGTSYRRRLIDADLEAVKERLSGRVLDIGGGRRRGRFRAPTQAQWIVADVSSAGQPHVRADVQALPFRDSAFDAIKITEVLEHVPDTCAALRECRRVLRPGGRLVATVPFLERLHGDPDDYVRYSDAMWRRLLAESGLTADSVTPQGGYFTQLAGMLRFLVQRSPAGLRHAGYVLFPLFDLMARIDRLASVRRSQLASFVGGYFITARR
ncbi:MAG TPA: methyltransferase domain-containing protein [Candidatus Polarisedimenticolaceae bacterium]|nr:methyltransferase domain-containing protein [Candidatus Polarisedimenticolaceae bacterium]